MFDAGNAIALAEIGRQLKRIADALENNKERK